MIEIYSQKTGKKVAVATDKEYLSDPAAFMALMAMQGRRCVWVHDEKIGITPNPVATGPHVERLSP